MNLRFLLVFEKIHRYAEVKHLSIPFIAQILADKRYLHNCQFLVSVRNLVDSKCHFSATLQFQMSISYH